MKPDESAAKSVSTDFKRQAALSNQVSENGSQIGIFKIVGNAIEMRNFGDESAPMCFPQIAHKATLGNGANKL